MKRVQSLRLHDHAITRVPLETVNSCGGEWLWTTMQKTNWEKTKYSRNETILKIGHHAKVKAFAKKSFGSKIKIQKNVRKTIL